MRYEYKTIADVSTYTLDEHGADGWRVVAAEYTGGGCWTVLLMREL